MALFIASGLLFSINISSLLMCFVSFAVAPKLPKLIDILSFSGRRNSSQRLPQYFIRAILVGANAVAVFLL